MIVAATEGEFFRFEVEEAYDGYCVTLRDLSTGAADDSSGIVFRTAAVALAYADMIATRERVAALDDDVIGAAGMTELRRECDRLSDHFQRLAARLTDPGAELEQVKANDALRGRLTRPRYH